MVLAIGDVAGGEVDRKRGTSEDVFVVSADVGSEGVISGAGTEFEALSNVTGK